MKNRALTTGVVNYLIESNLVKLNDKIVVAVSGGMDSMFLLYMLIELQKSLNLKLIIGHVNHNIRNNAKRDEQFVVEQGYTLGVPVLAKQLDYSSKKLGTSTEAWARENRYYELESIRKELNYNKIATGHHSNDQIETILQRITEKSGIGGLRGIHKHYNGIIRPILSISKAEIEKVVIDLNIPYVEDETNNNLENPRNYFRHKIIPQWESFYPDLGKSIQEICESANVNQFIMEFFFQNLVDEMVTEENDSHTNNRIKKININSFQKLPYKVKISFFAYTLGSSLWRKHQWNEIENIIKSAKTGKIYSWDEFEILKDRQDWIIRHKLKVNLEPIFIQLDVPVNYGTIKFVAKEVSQYSNNDNPMVEIIDADSIVNKNLVLRTWSDGDVFQPLGMNGSKKISDFLTDKKVNRFNKLEQLVLTANDEIIWVCGHRISETVKINKHTKHYLELSIKRNVG